MSTSAVKYIKIFVDGSFNNVDKCINNGDHIILESHSGDSSNMISCVDEKYFADYIHRGDKIADVTIPGSVTNFIPDDKLLSYEIDGKQITEPHYMKLCHEKISYQCTKCNNCKDCKEQVHFTEKAKELIARKTPIECKCKKCDCGKTIINGCAIHSTRNKHCDVCKNMTLVKRVHTVKSIRTPKVILSNIRNIADLEEWNNEQFCLDVAKVNGYYALRYAKTQTPELCAVAINQNVFASKFVK